MTNEQRFHLNRLADKLVTPERFAPEVSFPVFSVTAYMRTGKFHEIGVGAGTGAYLGSRTTMYTVDFGTRL